VHALLSLHGLELFTVLHRLLMHAGSVQTLSELSSGQSASLVQQLGMRRGALQAWVSVSQVLVVQMSSGCSWQSASLWQQPAGRGLFSEEWSQAPPRQTSSVQTLVSAEHRVPSFLLVTVQPPNPSQTEVFWHSVGVHV
jgi:hypothetical protein